MHRGSVFVKVVNFQEMLPEINIITCNYTLLLSTSGRQLQIAAQRAAAMLAADIGVAKSTQALPLVCV